MPFPSTYVSLHLITAVSANAPGGLGNPLNIIVKAYNGDTQITLHLPTADYAERMASAINDAVKKPAL